MLEHVFSCLKDSGVDQIAVILGGDLSSFDAFLSARPELSVCVQENRLGTGDAVAAAAPCFAGIEPIDYSSDELLQGGGIEAEYVIICAGDTPAIDSAVIKEFINDSMEKDSDMAVLGMEIPDPTGYGRLVVKGDELQQIVEQKDADEKTQKVNWVNSGVILAKTKVVFECLREITPSNAQKEYYLTDCIEVAQKKGYRTTAYKTFDWQGFSGVNDLQQKAAIEAYMLGRGK